MYTFEFLHDPWSGLIGYSLGAVVLVALATVVVFIATRTTDTYIRRGLLVLRGLVFAFVLLALLRPAIRFEGTRDTEPRIAVMLDTSGSMDVVHLGDQTREGLYRRWIGESRMLQSLADEADLTYLEFAETTRPFEDADDRGGLTAIVGSLTDALGRGATPRYDAVVLLSDGLQTLAPSGSLVGSAGLSNATNVPVWPVALPNGDSRDDLAITAVEVPEIAYTNEQVPLNVLLRRTQDADGLGEPLEVTVNVQLIAPNGERVPHRDEQLRIQFEPSADSAVASFTMLVEDAGHHLFKLNIEGQGFDVAEELTSLNNQTWASTTFISDAYRVLLLGRPSWDFRFLRRALERGRGFDVNALPMWEKSWQDFSERVALTEAAFDEADLIAVVHLAPHEIDVAWRDLLIERVEVDGTGLLWVLRDGLSSDRDRVEVLEDTLPLRADPDLLGLTDAVKALPVADTGYTRLSIDPLENEDIWDDLPRLQSSLIGVNPTASTKIILEGATTAQPLLVDGQAGLGRVAVLLGSGWWQWSFRPPERDARETIAPGERFFRRLAQSLVPTQETGDVQRLSPSRIYAPEAPFTLSYNIDSELPVSALSIELRPQLAADGTPLSGDAFSTDLTPASDNAAEAEIPGQSAGIYQATVTGSDGEIIHRSWVLVLPSREELIDLSIDTDFLESLAASGGTKTVAWSEREGLADFLSTQRQRIETVRRTELWDTLPYLLVVVALLTAEWWLRKRNGLR